jgi:hypothetical protein
MQCQALMTLPNKMCLQSSISKQLKVLSKLYAQELIQTFAAMG